MTPLVNATAKAIFDEDPRHVGCDLWSMPDWIQDVYRSKAQAALDVAVPRISKIIYEQSADVARQMLRTIDERKFGEWGRSEVQTVEKVLRNRADAIKLEG